MPDFSGQSIGRYHIIEPLGQGGMATVYLAHDTRLECEVAVKFIRMERLSPEEVERTLKRFEREAKEVARLTHPNIVKVTDYGEFNGTPYLVMEYLPGGTLKQFTGQRLPFQQAARLLAPVARALEVAHRKNLVHRDIKPGNILLTEESQPMVSDFGIAKILDMESGKSLTSTNMAIGTPEYMAPEQWFNKISPQSDIYSLGVVFYELVTGHKPYEADTPAAIFLKQSNDPLPRPRSFVPDLPYEVEKVLFKALAKQPEERYAGMGEFAAALEELAGLSKAVRLPQVFETLQLQPAAPEPPTIPNPPPELATPGSEERRLETPAHAAPAAAMAEPEVIEMEELNAAVPGPPAAVPVQMEVFATAEPLYVPQPVITAENSEEIIPVSLTSLAKPGRFGGAGAKWLRAGLLALFGLAVIGLAAFGIIRGSQGMGPLAALATETPTETPAPTLTAAAMAASTQASPPAPTLTTVGMLTSTPPRTATPTQTAAASETALPTSSATPVLTPTSTLEIGATRVAPKDGMVEMYVPAGEFLMGSADSDRDADITEKPQHTVYLDGFWIDKYEVNNAQYRLCVKEGGCTPPWYTGSTLREYYYGNNAFDNYPVIYVDWDQAQTYCQWAERKLPSEAEWEKAARGTDGRLYPWGNNPPSITLANYGQSLGDTTEGGHYPAGASPYGALDMAGNAAEWVADWYGANFYSGSPSRNPQGPSSGLQHGMRGGVFSSGGPGMRTANRGRGNPMTSLGGKENGFRCAVSASR